MGLTSALRSGEKFMSAGSDERRDMAKSAWDASVHATWPPAELGGLLSRACSSFGALAMSHHSAVAALLHRPVQAHRQRHTHRRRHAVMHASESGRSAGEVPPSWPGCVQQLSAVGFSETDADLMLRKAHGWGFQKYWRTTKDHEEPDEAALASRLAYLRTVCDGDEDLLRGLLTAFPEVVALDTNTVVAPNLALLERLYRIPPGPALAGVLKRKPQVLGNNLDCSGDCAGECNRCWARF